MFLTNTGMTGKNCECVHLVRVKRLLGQPPPLLGLLWINDVISFCFPSSSAISLHLWTPFLLPPPAVLLSSHFDSLFLCTPCLFPDFALSSHLNFSISQLRCVKPLSFCLCSSSDSVPSIQSSLPPNHPSFILPSLVWQITAIVIKRLKKIPLSLRA